MLLHLIALLSVGLGLAGLVIGVARLSGRKAPPWMAPLAAGLGMFGYVLWSDYTWFERNLAALPDGVEVIRTYPSSSLLRPWSLVAPPVERFAAIRRHASLDAGSGGDVVLVDLLLLTRYETPAAIRQAIDCDGARRGDLDVVQPGDQEARLKVKDWQPLDPDDPMLIAACRDR